MSATEICRGRSALRPCAGRSNLSCPQQNTHGQGLCQSRAGNNALAEKTLLSGYEIDAGNPVVAYNIGVLLFQRGDFKRAQFYVRRLNNSERANAESLWLGIKIERALKDPVAVRQLGDQLRRRFPDSREHSAFQRGAFDE